MAKTAVAPEDKSKGKRGHYQQKECPYCNKPVGNLANHIRLKHADQAKAEGYPVKKTPPPEVNKDDLLGITKPPPPGEKPAPGSVYYCIGCRAKLRKGENPCWNCGEPLAWEGID